MRAEFSEFTYGFAVVHELAQQLGCTVAPIFPSLIEEGQDGGGYDVKMNVGALPFYLQFKLSEYLKTNNAKEAKLAPMRMAAPYRRFAITSSVVSAQHEMLVALNGKHDHVFYCAPNYVTQAELNAYWKSGTAAARSIFIKPSEIGPITDGGKHAVCFNSASLYTQKCYLFSDPKSVLCQTFGQMRSDLQRSLKQSDTPLRELLPRWLDELDKARDEGKDIHANRVAAIRKLQEEKRQERLDRQSKDDLYEVDTRELRRPTFDIIPGVPETGTIRTVFEPPVPTPPTTEDPDRAALVTFGSRALTEFGVQAFILQPIED